MNRAEKPDGVVIRKCQYHEIPLIGQVINDGAQAYRGVIPSDRWKEPYMKEEELRHEIGCGVEFWAYEEKGELIGVMGIQYFPEATLIRHAYVRTASRKQGIGSRLLIFLLQKTKSPVLIGTWTAARWAIQFYEKHGFKQVSPEEKNRLLRRYWTIPERQVETSIVLADSKWFRLKSGSAS